MRPIKSCPGEVVWECTTSLIKAHRFVIIQVRVPFPRCGIRMAQRTGTWLFAYGHIGDCVMVFQNLVFKDDQLSQLGKLRLDSILEKISWPPRPLLYLQEFGKKLESLGNRGKIQGKVGLSKQPKSCHGRDCGQLVPALHADAITEW
jgi:hypothetical protein